MGGVGCCLAGAFPLVGTGNSGVADGPGLSNDPGKEAVGVAGVSLDWVRSIAEMLSFSV